VFHADDPGTPLASFFAFDPSFTGGVQVAVNTTPGQPPVLVAAPGDGGAPIVRGLTDLGNDESFSFFAFDPASRGGVFVG
jgi:hypothetical protein